MTVTALLAIAPIVLIAAAVIADKFLPPSGNRFADRRFLLIGAGTLLALDHLFVFILLLDGDAALFELFASSITAVAGLVVAAEAWGSPQVAEERT